MTQPTTILVLEDNDFVRMQIVKFLRDAEYDVVEATGVSEAMEVIKSDEKVIECALVDVRMEPEDGFAFIQRLEANDIDISVILVTGDQNHDILSKATQMGVSSVLMKPVNKDRLIKMVERTIAVRGKKS